MIGVVKVFFAHRGFGWIRQADGSDVFFHVSDCAIPELEISKGQRVTYEVVMRGVRAKAVNVDAVLDRSAAGSAPVCAR
jgi:cold shock CspA family protein